MKNVCYPIVSMICGVFDSSCNRLNRVIAIIVITIVRNGIVIHKPQLYPLESKRGHSSRLSSTKITAVKIASRSCMDNKIIGRRYKIHCGLQPGDQSKKIHQVIHRKVTKDQASLTLIFKKMINPITTKQASDRTGGITAGLPFKA